MKEALDCNIASDFLIRSIKKPHSSRNPAEMINNIVCPIFLRNGTSAPSRMSDLLILT